MAATTILITGSDEAEVKAKQKALQYMNNNLTQLEVQRLEVMARSEKARALLNDNWPMLQSFI